MIDLADRDYRTVSNMAISQLLGDIWGVQDQRYRNVRQSGGVLIPVEVLVEEADLLLPRGRRDKGEQMQNTIIKRDGDHIVRLNDIAEIDLDHFETNSESWFKDEQYLIPLHPKGNDRLV